MKKIGDAIEFEKGKESLLIHIFPRADKSKMNLFKIWLLMWTVTGIAAIYAVVAIELPKTDLLFMFVYLAFWGYFEIKMLNALRWQSKGKEIIEIKDGEFRYTKEIAGKGLPKIVPVNELGAFKYQEKSEGGFLNDISKSVWFVGGEVVEYRTKTSVRRLGMKLNQKDAEKLADLINKTARL